MEKKRQLYSKPHTCLINGCLRGKIHPTYRGPMSPHLLKLIFGPHLPGLAANWQKGFSDGSYGCLAFSKTWIFEANKHKRKYYPEHPYPS